MASISSKMMMCSSCDIQQQQKPSAQCARPISVVVVDLAADAHTASTCHRLAAPRLHPQHVWVVSHMSTPQVATILQPRQHQPSQPQ
jgi:hypothetical protein